MNASPDTTRAFERRNCNAFELRFARLCNTGRGYVFPCDAEGHVDIDSLVEPARSNYLFARTVIGREFFAPVVCLNRSLSPPPGCAYRRTSDSTH